MVREDAEETKGVWVWVDERRRRSRFREWEKESREDDSLEEGEKDRDKKQKEGDGERGRGLASTTPDQTSSDRSEKLEDELFVEGRKNTPLRSTGNGRQVKPTGRSSTETVATPPALSFQRSIPDCSSFLAFSPTREAFFDTQGTQCSAAN